MVVRVRTAIFGQSILEAHLQQLPLLLTLVEIPNSKIAAAAKESVHGGVPIT